MGVLDGKAIVVTGGARGIGRAHCLQLAAEGAQVVVNDIDGLESAKVIAELEARGASAVADDSHISSEAGATALVARCVEAFGRIDGLVANAGVSRDRSFLKMSTQEFTDVWQVHVLGTFHCCQAAARRMREQGEGGSLVTTTSAAQFGNFGQANYAAAKGAISSMTFTMALELARHGIRANGISPAGTTRLSATYKGPDGKERPMPFLDPELNGPMLVYLLSEEADWITGQIFGTGADRLLLLSHPQYARGLHCEGGWTLDQIRKKLRPSLGGYLEPFGIQKRPYAFQEGVKPQ